MVVDTPFDDPRYAYAATVERVVDGDTLDVRADLGMDVGIGQRLRLLGVDTDEKYGVSPDSPEYERARSQSRFVRGFLSQDGEFREILIRTVSDDTGKYGRYLALVWRLPDGRSLQRRLLNEFGDSIANPTNDCPHREYPEEPGHCRYCRLEVDEWEL